MKNTRLGLSMALGVGQVTALEMVAAYGVFANGGYLKQPYFIEKIIPCASPSVIIFLRTDRLFINGGFRGKL